jgi:putative addiction module component (TIGR02574 family)
MATLSELEPQVLALSERERADLAARLLSSLPPVLDEEDDGVAEALRREQEAEADPSACISSEEFEQGMARLRGR